jgi:hypothetical protein
MQAIVSAVPGRLRIKDGRFAEPAAANDYVARLQQTVGGDTLLATRINPAATSVVVRFDHRRIALAELRRHAETLLLPCPAAAAPRRTKPPAGRRSRRMRLNRYAKIAALASLAASMGFAAAGSKRLHVITGMLFLACLSAHLAVFRRTLTH